MRHLIHSALAVFVALGLAAPSYGQDQAQTEASAETQQSAAGEYTIPDSFEMYVGLLLREDATFEFALSVGAMDKKSAGTWKQDGQTVTLTTTPKPVPPVFERAERNEAADAPFLLVTWPNGRGIAGITFALGCENNTKLSDYTQSDGWSPPEGSCTMPEWIELTESIHEIYSPRFDISEESGALHFVLQPNSFGVLDMTGATGVLDGETLSLGFMGTTEDFVRVRRE